MVGGYSNLKGLAYALLNNPSIFTQVQRSSNDGIYRVYQGGIACEHFDMAGVVICDRDCSQGSPAGSA